jgi:hypothetical protein
MQWAMLHNNHLLDLQYLIVEMSLKEVKRVIPGNGIYICKSCYSQRGLVVRA